jgi:hypothetical protein
VDIAVSDLAFAGLGVFSFVTSASALPSPARRYPGQLLDIDMDQITRLIW